MLLRLVGHYTSTHSTRPFLFLLLFLLFSLAAGILRVESTGKRAEHLMRTAWRLLGLHPGGQECLASSTPRGPLLLLQERSRRNCLFPKHCVQRFHVRLLHMFPSLFHRQSQSPDPFGSALPPAHIPLPPSVQSQHEECKPELADACNSGASTCPEKLGEKEAKSGAPVGSTTGLTHVIKTHVAAQRWMQQRIWGALTRRQWPLFERLLSNYWRCGLNYDEVSYTLKLHGYILCHRQKPEKAFLVLEEMKAAGMHPAIIRLNEGIVISQMELQDIFCALPADAYQNLCRLAFHSAIKVQRQRRIRLRERLLATPPEKLFSLTYRDVLKLLDAQERALCFPDEALAVIAVDSWNETTSLEGNATFLRAFNEALGLEGSSGPAELLEETEENGDTLHFDESFIRDSLPELNSPLSELHEQLRGAGDPEDVSEGPASRESNQSECTPAFSTGFRRKPSHASPTAARATHCCSGPQGASIEEFDLRPILPVSEATPTRLLQWKARLRC